jgi:hydrogenase-4 component E
MTSVIEIIMVLLVLSDMAILGLNRLKTCINILAFQGMLLGAFAFISQMNAISLRLVMIAGASFILKGFVFPALLNRVMQDTGIQRENEPFVGYTTSVLAGLFMLVFSLWLGSEISARANSEIPLIVPAALTTLLTGLFLIVARKNALTQCLGYIILENGIYIIGVVTVVEIPVLVELGILLDVFVAVLVMGIAIHHISREFDHIDADKLNILKG